MCALIALAVWDTVKNDRTKYTKRTLTNLFNGTIDIDKHRVVIVDNGSCEETKDFLNSYNNWGTIITNKENVGTAKAINQAWALRKDGEHLIKMDNDVEIFTHDWVDEMEEVINLSERLPKPIGILGLKRVDLFEDTYRNDGYRSTLVQIPHLKGEYWHNVEIASHIMGTCQMYNHKLIDKIGGLEQMDGLYGFDDSIASLKSELSGFVNAFLSHIKIDHIDTADNKGYTEWKADYANEMWSKFNELVEDYKSGVRDMYVPIED